MLKSDKNFGINTLSVHAGEGPDSKTGASAPNVVMSTTFVLDEAGGSFSALSLTDEAPYVYTRFANPTADQLEKKTARLERAGSAVAYSTGMAATVSLWLHLLKAGDQLILSDVSYAGVAELARDTLVKLGIEVTLVNLSDLDELKSAIKPNLRLVHAETPVNPILRLTDIRAVADIAHAAGAEFVVDSTFATPIATRPIELGADYVLHSLTKYMGGHGDALGGIVAGSAERMARLRQDTAIHFGGTISPFNAWLIMRGMATLPIRMAAHAENARRVAEYLESHPKINRVIYPGLPSHPQYELACRQMSNFSGMVVFQAKDGVAAAHRMAEKLEIIHYAVSLGHHRSLIFYLITEDMQKNSFRLEGKQLAGYREWAGDGIFRLSVGLEDADDLCRDLDAVL